VSSQFKRDSQRLTTFLLSWYGIPRASHESSYLAGQVPCDLDFGQQCKRKAVTVALARNWINVMDKKSLRGISRGFVSAAITLPW
jgi:hypothetical protein